MAVDDAGLLVTNFDLDKELNEWIILVLWKKDPFFHKPHLHGQSISNSQPQKWT